MQVNGRGPVGREPCHVVFGAVSDQLLTVLKLCLLALLYLFFFRVVRAVWAEISTTAPAPGPAPAAAPAAAARPARAPAPAPAAPAPRAATPGRLVIVEPTELRGKAFALSGDTTVGRAASCTLTLDDTFASQQHARISGPPGQYVVEDLGSTNGTYLNRQRVSGPTALNPGDRIQIGNTVLELA